MQDNGVLWIYGDVQALMRPKQRQAILTVKNTSKVNVYLHVNRSFTLTTKFAVAIVSGSTAPTTYTPYIGQTNTLTLPETIYGGEVDAVNGEGQETWKMLTLEYYDALDAASNVTSENAETNEQIENDA